MVLKKIILSMLMIICMLGTVNAAAGLNVILANQDPDPVSPGNFVYLNVKVSNIGDSQIRVNKLTMLENEHFTLAQKENNDRDLGILSGYSRTDNAKTFVVEKYKILVDKDTPLGLNTLEFEVESDSGKFKYEFNVFVSSNNPLVSTQNIESKVLKPGEDGKLSITLENLNNMHLNDVKVALQLGDIDENSITINQGSNEKFIKHLEAQDNETFVFDISINPEALSKSYLVPIKVSYKDPLENMYENTIYGSVKVFAQPELLLTLNSQSIYNVGKGTFTLAIANPGTSKVKGVQLNLLDSQGYEVVEGKNQYIGDLNPDDFQTIQTEIYVKNVDSDKLKIELNYLDSYDNKKSEIIEVPIKIYTQEELIEYGIVQEQGFSTLIIVIILLVVIVGFFYWRKNKKAKLERLRNN